ncbi:DUF2147 domain-containing protein [Aurantiacibacter rhizosphaerae]|uniref:DUF2147 domain-containing protein n=1 Tax=Aurantiacibacter rhizosphaerae TaxID=2691582 RepID=A0A844XBE1_9SPHN|nr:DUF2147 domain-containing protein [Aurantiacibacter rhizosphaerae]MWV27099.1 DUF2147 domain-containing protein [Aurantiacibacter rhizosphaerae]
MGLKKLALIAASATALLASPAAAQSNIDGVYKDSDGYTEITVAPCGNARCGEITRILKRKPGEPTNDVHNDNPALRKRPILGITILKNLRWDDDVWRGEVYNPEDGNTYRTEVRPAANGALEVKGCVTLFCRSRIWPAAR